MSHKLDTASPDTPAVIAGQKSEPLELVSCKHDSSTLTTPAVIAVLDRNQNWGLCHINFTVLHLLHLLNLLDRIQFDATCQRQVCSSDRILRPQK